MNRYTICHLVSNKDIQPNEVFSSLDWPMHITLLGSFIIDISAEELTLELEKIAQNIAPFTVTVGEESYLGANKDILVNLIEKNDTLNQLHNNILNCLSNYPLQVRNPSFNADGYIPHITVQKTERFMKNDVIELRGFHLIQHEPHGIKHERQLVDTFNFAQ